MFKKISQILAIVIVLSIILSSCSQTKTPSSEADLQNADRSSHGQKIDFEISDPAEDENDVSLIHGIDVVEYPNPYMVSEYYDLTEDQKIAYDALAVALKDILANYPNNEESYPLAKRVSMNDYSTARNLLSANFTSADSILYNIFCSDSYGTHDHVDSVFLWDYENQNESDYKIYLETAAAADKILASLDHDGTEYGKALAIAKWMVDNIYYPPDYEERLEDDLGSAHTALINKEAICDGYARAYDLLCKKAGLETIYIVSWPADTEGHAWNMIKIDEKWYHVDVTWMDSEGQFYREFMMTDSICKAVGHHIDEATYYWCQASNEDRIPKAYSYDLYKYAYADLESALGYYENEAEIYDYASFTAVLPDESPDDVLALKGRELTSSLDGNTYYISTYEVAPKIYNFSFTQKRDGASPAGVPVCDGMIRVEQALGEVLNSFIPGSVLNVDNVRMTFDIPDYFIKDDSEEGFGGYMFLDEETMQYRYGINFLLGFKVESDFVMDESIHNLWYWDYTYYEISTGTTKNGYNYVLCEQKLERSYYTFVYFRVSDEYIAVMNYCDSSDKHDSLLKIIDSLRVAES